MTVLLRPATADDSHLLFAWRNDPATVAASLNPRPVLPDEHERWLAAVLSDPDRQIYIAEEAGRPVGMARSERREGVCELSWSVDPACRGRGLAKQIVTALLDRTPLPVRARIRDGNSASIRVAGHAGLRLCDEIDGVLVFEKKNSRS
jgi:RimJ/RimL family protein N-acetyltransferase